MTETASTILIRGAEVWSPAPRGRQDVLCGGGAILAVEAGLDAARPPGTRVIDGRGMKLLPGLVDGHVHIAGAGGEGGPATRTPEMTLSQMIAGGTTTVVGLLGADGVTRNLEGLLMKAKGLRAEGVSAWIWTGAYQLPPPTLTGGVARDLALVAEVIGVGEIAVADHRSSSPTVAELVKLAKEARLGGMLGGKCGLVHLHLGDAEGGFAMIRAAVEGSELGLAQFLPTHVNRTARVFAEALDYGREGPVDVTASAWPYFQEEEVKPSRAVRELLAAGVPPAHVTMSSDACGSLPDFDAAGRLRRLASGRPAALWDETAAAVGEGLDLERALALVTANPARRLRLPGKGAVAPGHDADLLLVDEDLRVRWVLARGAVMMEDGEIRRRGAFE
ncbi:MAG: beta-aspartyl-peptidase [Acidobacteriota bacterium]|nr:beta-aspartyl-peptidase [Acidobacteriota bacterium]MDH3524488.1 beta-aspartyl-peptidase [Acidobacteriota bacterium]